MRRALVAGGEVGGSAQEWGGGQFKRRRINSTSRPYISNRHHCPLSSFWQDSVAGF